MADASRMLAPIVAQEVEKETKKIEIRMQVRAHLGVGVPLHQVSVMCLCIRCK